MVTPSSSAPPQDEGGAGEEDEEEEEEEREYSPLEAVHEGEEEGEEDEEEGNDENNDEENNDDDKAKDGGAPSPPSAPKLGGARRRFTTFKDAGAKVQDDVKDDEEHASFIARREHFGRTKRNAPRKTKSTIARGAVRLMFNGCAGSFTAWWGRCQARTRLNHERLERRRPDSTC